MKTKKGFISTSVVYSFFLVFILLMLAMLLSLTNKRVLIKKINEEGKKELDIICSSGDTLEACLLKHESVDKSYKTANIETIKGKISSRSTPDFSNVSISDEGMYEANDDYGTSYYYRGAVEDNYLRFGGALWRIIRINGDASIRMIYQGDGTKDGDFLRYNEEGNIIKDSDWIHYDSNGIVEETTDTPNFVTSKKHYNLSDWDSAGKTFYCNLKDYYTSRYNICMSNHSTSSQWLCKGYKNLLEYNTTECSKSESSVQTGAYTMRNVGFMTGIRSWSVSDESERISNNDNSLVLDRLYEWYENGVINQDYLSVNTLFCGDKSIERAPSGKGYCLVAEGPNRKWDKATKWTEGLWTEGNWWGVSPTICSLKESWSTISYLSDDDWAEYNIAYSFGYRVKRTSNMIVGNFQPSLSCSDTSSNYSFYCSGGNCGEKVGTSADYGNLKNPIGLINVDEIVMAGGVYGEENSSYYLASNNDYWTMNYAAGSNASKTTTKALYFTNGNRLGVKDDAERVYPWTSEQDSHVATIRPVLNLKKDIEYCDGNGTKDKPFQIIDSTGNCSN